MLLSRVRRTLRERALVARGERVLVGCSGGPDSTALVHGLVQLSSELGLEIEVASIDHGLRPEAASEVDRVCLWVGSLGVAFHTRRIEVQRAGSLQAAARVARYEALRDIAALRRCAKIAVAHTADDQAETVVGRLVRGAGLCGLSGIDPRRPDGVIRPLIDTRRAEVMEYVEYWHLPTLSDPSNHDPRFERTRLRSTVLPALQAEDAAIVEHLSNLADEARSLREILRESAETLLAGGASVQALSAAPASIRQMALGLWVRATTGRSASRAHLEALQDVLRGQGQVRLGNHWIAEVVEGCVVARQTSKTLPSRAMAR